MASSSTSASTSHGNRVYDVFLNHRGDVKKTLASHIYQGLTQRGLRVFFDIEEMQEGEGLTPQIINAIRTASAHVAIFSKGYASSHWCLDELVEMVKTKKPIIPIFYDVNPSELRWTQARYGVYARALSIIQCILQCKWGEDRGYARALRILEKKTKLDNQTKIETPRYDSTTIKNWREALSSAAEISGFERNKFNGDGLLVVEVIQRVLKTVPKTLLNVAMYPTGLDVKVEEVEAIVSSQQQSGSLARAVGIVGLGGVGKTTLAKQFFNSHTSNFERSCFLSDVREKAGRNSLNSNSLQYQLLKDLAGYNVQINSPDEGIEMLRKYLPSSCRALICIDDVDHLDQLSALFFPVKHTNSLILITSRNKDVLRSAEIEESSIYMVKGLNTQHSKELFCRHAFKQSYPVKGFEQLVDNFLGACGGLPLSLKVIGALLYVGNNDLNYWKEQSHKISKILPEDIKSTLEISYNGLDQEEKQIFLDIACFFIGNIQRDTAIRIWDGCGWQGWLGLRNLENRCLVEVDSKNRITMHDHLRDLGRDLAEKAEYPLRLWRMEDHLHNRPNHSSVRGIHMVYRNDAEHFFENLADSCNMSKLQLLRAEGDFVERLFNVNGHFRHLLYLHWDYCPYSSLPPSIPIKNLRVLYIKGGILETLWQEESQAPLEMREMVIRAKLKMIPKSIGKLKHLEKIDLSSEYLESLPDSVGNLENLKSLYLCRCSGLQKLPDSVGNMTNLQSLNLRDCSSLEMLPDSVGNMTNLQSLLLFGCSALQMLPDSVGNMTNLQILYLGSCSALQMLPDSVGNMTNLQSLDLEGCSALQMLPDSVGNMTNLQSLNLDGCGGLQTLPDTVGNMTNLQSLDLSQCHGLQTLPDMVGNMTNLQSLDLSQCRSFQTLPDSVGNMTNLQSLDLSECRGLQMLPDSVGNMTNLQSLDLSDCGLQMLPDSVGNMTNLQRLDLSNCLLQMLPDSVGNMTYLLSLDLSNCGLQMLPDSVWNLKYLQSLDLSDCRLQMLPDSVGNLRNLQSLDLSNCGLQMLPDSVWNLTNLQSLDLSDCRLQMLPDSVGNLMNLQSLDLSNCGLQMLPDSVWNLTNLQSLDLSDCRLQMLPDSVGNMTKLQSLDLSDCGLQMLPDSVGNMTNLRRLDLSNCFLQMLPDSVGNMTKLLSLDLSDCGLQMLPDSVGNLTNLQSLDLSKCGGLEMLPDSVGNMTNLKSLALSECCGLQRLPDSVANMTNLQSLTLIRCSSLQMLPDSFGNLTNLKYLGLQGCCALQRLPDSDAPLSRGKMRMLRHLFRFADARRRTSEALSWASAAVCRRSQTGLGT